MIDQEIENRNKAVMERMARKSEVLRAQDANMTLQDLIDFTQAEWLLLSNKNINKVKSIEEATLLTWFLRANIDTQEYGIGEQCRYKLMIKYNWAVDNAIRDWNNRFEMGK